MSDLLNVYTPSDVTVTLTRGDGFSHTIGGYTEDTMVTVEPSAEAFSLFTSADNKSTLITNTDTSAMVTLHLNQASASNDVLSALEAQFRGSRNPEHLITVMVKDQGGRSMYLSPQAFIGKRPTVTYSKGMQTREWSLHCPAMQQTAGGNSKLSAADKATIERLGGVVEDRWAL